MSSVQGDVPGPSRPPRPSHLALGPAQLSGTPPPGISTLQRAPCQRAALLGRGRPQPRKTHPCQSRAIVAPGQKLGLESPPNLSQQLPRAPVPGPRGCTDWAPRHALISIACCPQPQACWVTAHPPCPCPCRCHHGPIRQPTHLSAGAATAAVSTETRSIYDITRKSRLPLPSPQPLPVASPGLEIWAVK